MVRLIRWASIIITCFVILLLIALSCTPLVDLIPYTHAGGSLIYVKPINDYSEIIRGDSITYKLDNDGSIATNEVFAVDKEKCFYYIRASEYTAHNGMQNSVSAITVGGVSVVPVDFVLLLGKNVASFPLLGYVAELISTTTGLLIFAGIGVVFAFLAGILPSGKKKNKPEKKRE